MERQKFDGRDAKSLEIGDFPGEAPVRAGMDDTRIRVGGEPAEVGFIDHRIGQRRPRRTVAGPIVIVLGQEQAFGEGRAVAGPEAGLEPGPFAPAPAGVDGPGVGIEEPLVGIEQAEAAVHAEEIALPGPDALDLDCPEIAPAVKIRIKRNFPIGGRGIEAVEEHQPDTFGMPAVDGEDGTRMRPAETRPKARCIGHAETIAPRGKTVNTKRSSLASVQTLN